MLVLLFLVSLGIFFIFLLPKLQKKGRKRPHPPGPRGLPLIGNMHQMNSPALHEYLSQLSKKYGSLMSLRLASTPVIVVSSATMAKEVLKNHDQACCGRPSMISLQKLSYNGLDIAFSSYNEYWREVRKICVLHLFSSKRVLYFRPIREDEISRMIQQISTFASTSRPANVSEIVMALSGAIICRLAFGKSYEGEGNESSRFREFLTDFQAMVGGFFVSDYFPSIGWIDKISGKIARLEKTCRELDSFYEELIDEHRNSMRPEAMKEDVLDILLQLREDKSASIHLSMDHIKALLMDIFIAATDTSAAAITWAMTALIRNPGAMKKVQEEIRKMIGKKGKVNEDDVQNLPYLKAVVKETLRLYPPAPLLVPHETIESCIIDGYQIQPKTVVYINAWAISRDPASWDAPEEFLPERFLDSPIDFKGLHFEYIPFGAGRRGCPGMSLGVATVELALANLLYSFNWELPVGMKNEDVDTNVKPGLTMHKKNDLCLVAKVYE